MIPVGTSYENPRTGARLSVTRNDAEAVAVERLMRPRTGRADGHVHFDFEQWFEVGGGIGTIHLDGTKQQVESGERVHVPHGLPHVDLYNDTDEDLVFTSTISPAPYFAQVFVATLGSLMERDALNDQGEFRDLQLFPVLRAGRAKSFRAGPPVAVQKPVIAIGAAIGRARGHRAITP